MAITPKEKELTAVGISVAAGCEPRSSYHLKEIREDCASANEIKQAVADNLCMRKSSTEIMEDYALVRLDEREV